MKTVGMGAGVVGMMALLGCQQPASTGLGISAGPRLDQVVGCEQDNALHCYNAARDFYFGHHGPVDRKMGDVMAKKSCNLGDADGCGLYAYGLYEWNPDVHNRLNEGFKHAQVGCTSGSENLAGTDCLVAAGFVNLNGQHERAATWAWKGCVQGEGIACEQVGSFYWRDGSAHTQMRQHYYVKEGHADLPGKAWVAYEMGCALGSSTACGSLGALLATEPRVAMDEPRAVALLTQSCDDPESYKREYHCEVFGDVLAKQGKATAAYVYEENCDRKAAASCAKAATLYAEGQLVTQNPARAEALAASACDLGVTTACG